MLLDFCFISGLLLIAHLIRARLGILQRLYIPSPILAGFAALLLGDQGFDAIPFSETDQGKVAMSAYPSVLISLLFATILMGGAKEKPVKPQAMVRQAGDTFFYNTAGEVGQYGVALLFGLILIMPLFPDLNPSFSLMMPAGFVGGHGTVTAMSQVYEKHDWPESLSIGYTFATVGLLSGIIGGMILINLGTHLKWTRLVRHSSELPASLKSGMVPEKERRPIGHETVNPIALDPLTWHIGLVLVAYGIAYLADTQIRAWTEDRFSMPLFALALLAGGILQKGMNWARLGSYVDRSIMERIGSMLSDFLVAFGVASIRLDVVVEHAVPLAIMSALGITYSAAMLYWLGPRLFRDYWFERSIFVYGWNTGVVGIGIALLRVVDPRLRSGTLRDFGFAYVGISFVTIALIVGMPQLLVRGYIVIPTIVLLAVAIGCLVLSRYLIGWFPHARSERRAGEVPMDDQT